MCNGCLKTLKDLIFTDDKLSMKTLKFSYMTWKFLNKVVIQFSAAGITCSNHE